MKLYTVYFRRTTMRLKHQYVTPRVCNHIDIITLVLYTHTLISCNTEWELLVLIEPHFNLRSLYVCSQGAHSEITLILDGIAPARPSEWIDTAIQFHLSRRLLHHFATGCMIKCMTAVEPERLAPPTQPFSIIQSQTGKWSALVVGGTVASRIAADA